MSCKLIATISNLTSGLARNFIASIIIKPDVRHALKPTVATLANGYSKPFYIKCVLLFKKIPLKDDFYAAGSADYRSAITGSIGVRLKKKAAVILFRLGACFNMNGFPVEGGLDLARSKFLPLLYFT
ncbi:hypothetical protein [Microcoleus sp. FACHB-672]|uniref:hypothetical protein n=1 Tax=Microcoleus sp. FACHB-672 TaxID=2692825 RepID=UPI001682D593|nr:hypothetical protein [Microcoleus sp. FACHB-672]MBD2041998.1 hypothetical protein [Microcoleus sp. FACHB-672]